MASGHWFHQWEHNFRFFYSSSGLLVYCPVNVALFLVMGIGHVIVGMSYSFFLYLFCWPGCKTLFLASMFVRGGDKCYILTYFCFAIWVLVNTIQSLSHFVLDPKFFWIWCLGLSEYLPLLLSCLNDLCELIHTLIFSQKVKIVITRFHR